MRACEPQHSPSLVQVSPSTWQPVAGWQMSTPVGPHGAHRRPQQLPPQPPSANETAVQLPPWVTAPRAPTLWPLGMVQTPLQQSAPREQMSLVCWQKDDGSHEPSTQLPEQHWELVVHVLSKVSQAPPFTDAHVWLVQVWLQHSPAEVHPLPSVTHPPSPKTPVPTSPPAPASEGAPLSPDPAPSWSPLRPPSRDRPSSCRPRSRCRPCCPPSRPVLGAVGGRVAVAAVRPCARPVATAASGERDQAAGRHEGCEHERRTRELHEGLTPWGAAALEGEGGNSIRSS